MTPNEKIAADLAALCDQHGIPECVCIFDIPGGQSLTLHIASNGNPSPGYEAIKGLITEFMQECDRILKTANG